MTVEDTGAGHGQAAVAPRGRTHNQMLGAYGEAAAARHLVDAGLVVLDRNWRGEVGEVDLVLRDGATLVVCEVKTRTSSRFGHPVEGVTAVKAARLRRLAARWMADHRVRVDDVRLDVVGVLVPPGGATEIEHVRGVG